MLRRLLESLDEPGFLRFIKKSWDSEPEEEHHPEGLLKRDTYELDDNLEGLFERFVYRGPDKIEDVKTGFSSYSLYYPLNYPLELFESPSDVLLIKDDIGRRLKNYKKYFESIKNNWYTRNWGVLSPYPNLYFFANYSGFPESFYLDEFLPPLHDTISKYLELNHLGVGCTDSFLELGESNVENVLSEMLASKSMSIVFEEDAIQVKQSVHQKYLTTGTLENISQPVSPIFDIINEHDVLIREFQEVLNTGNEKQIQSYLFAHYREIFGPHYTEVRQEVWINSKESDEWGKDRRIDLMLKNALDDDWDIIELKRNKNPIKQYRGKETFIAEVYDSISQLKNYKRILQQDKVKEALKRKGIEYQEPSLRLVVGNNYSINKSIWRRIVTESSNSIKISRYQDLLEEMRIRKKDLVSCLKKYWV